MNSDAYMALINFKKKKPEMRCRQRHLPSHKDLTSIYKPDSYHETPYRGFRSLHAQNNHKKINIEEGAAIGTSHCTRCKLIYTGNILYNEAP